MDNQELIENWQNEIIKICEIKLSRKLTSLEFSFIRSKQAFMGLEFIEDEMKAASREEVEAFLKRGVELEKRCSK